MTDLSSLPRSGQAVVIGCTGAIGGAFQRQLSGSGRFAVVHGLGRRTDPPLDLTDEDSIAGAASAVAARDEPLRLVIVATGHLHDDDYQPEKSLRALNAAQLQRSFALNAIGPALIMKHFLPLIPRDGKAVFAVLSARVGSIQDNRYGGWYGYRASKAALNQMLKSASVELARKRPEAICVALHPGTVRSALSDPFAKDGLTVRDPDTAAAEMLDVIDSLTPSDTGSFRAYDGGHIPW